MCVCVREREREKGGAMSVCIMVCWGYVCVHAAVHMCVYEEEFQQLCVKSSFQTSIAEV